MDEGRVHSSAAAEGSVAGDLNQEQEVEKMKDASRPTAVDQNAFVMGASGLEMLPTCSLEVETLEGTVDWAYSRNF